MKLAEAIYDRIGDEHEGRLCDDIPDNACGSARRSFFLILASYVLTKLGDAIASPKTTLAWVTTALGAPAWVLGFLVPIRESGSMIPQLFIGAAIRSFPVRKWVWVLGSAGQCLCIVGIGLVTIWLDGVVAGWAILGLVTLFSLARGFSSVAAKDVIGKTIPRPRRGRLTGWATSAAGLVSVGIGVVLMMPAMSDLDTTLLGALLIAAGMLWLVAASVYSGVPEVPGETAGGRSAVDALKRLSLLVTDGPFRRFVMTRALLMCSALSAPFYVALAQGSFGSPGYLLGAFVVATASRVWSARPYGGATRTYRASAS